MYRKKHIYDKYIFSAQRHSQLQVDMKRKICNMSKKYTISNTQEQENDIVHSKLKGIDENNDTQPMKVLCVSFTEG